MLTDMVTDEDRKAAAEIYQNRRDHDMHKWILDGRCDADPIVRAFARHRIAAEQRGYQQGMEEAAVVAEDCMVMLSLGTPGDGPFTKQDRAADETRAAIATAIRAKAKEKKHGTR